MLSSVLNVLRHTAQRNRRSLRRWIYQGGLKAPPTGRNTRVSSDKGDLEAFLTPAGTITLSRPLTSRQTAVETILALQRRLAGRGPM
jgi:hypothetical protein